MRLAAIMLVCSLTTLSTLAQPTIDVVDLGGGNLDLVVSDLGGGAVWTAGGLAGTAQNGASFVYAADPNGVLTLNNPLGGNAVTFVTAPIGASKRPPFPTASLAGKYTGGTGAATALNTALDVAYFDPPGGQSYATGQTARVALDIGGTGFAHRELFAIKGAAPAGTTTLASGVATATTDTFTDADAAEITWTVYAIPEPTTIALLVLSGLAALRRTS